MEDPVLSPSADDSDLSSQMQTNGNVNQVIDKVTGGIVFANVTGNVTIPTINNYFPINGAKLAEIDQLLSHYRGINQLDVSKYEAISEDIEIWKQVYFSAYESVGATANHFIVFDKNNKKRQIPISSLWTMEGQGLIIPDSKFNVNQNTSDLKLIAIRRIIEHLNIKAYEVLYRNADF